MNGNNIFFKKYLLLIRILVIINLPLSVIGTFGGFRDFTTYLFLIPLLVVDMLFITINLRRLIVNVWEVVLICLIFCSLIIGLLNYDVSRRVITDTLNPLFFVMKIAVLRSYLRDVNFEVWFGRFITRSAKYLIISGGISIILFFFLSRITPMYSGLTPVTHPFFIEGLIGHSLLKQGLALVIAFLSGKRALIVSSIVIILVYKLYIQRKFKSRAVFIISIAVLVLLGLNLNLASEGFSAIDKYKWTYETIRNSDFELSLADDTGILDMLTAGRMGEVSGALVEMKPFDYLIGKGSGFTYTFSSAAYEEKIENYANLHFTPLNIITKYGFIFFITILTYFLFCLKGFRFNGVYGVFMGLYLIGFCIDMLFAYVIFVDPILPLVLGYLSYKRK